MVIPSVLIILLLLALGINTVWLINSLGKIKLLNWKLEILQDSLILKIKEFDEKKYNIILEVIKEYCSSIEWGKLRKVESFENWITKKIKE